MKTHLTCMAGLALLANTAAQAGGGMEGYGIPPNMNFYGGVSAGGVQQDGACQPIANTENCEKSATGYKVFAGTRLEPRANGALLPSLGVEGGYIDLGTSKADGEILSTRNIALGDAKASSDVSAVYVAGVGYLPVAPQTEVVGKAGLAYWQQKGKIEVPADPALGSSSNNSGLGLILGGGAQFKVTENISIRGEYEHIFGTGKDTDYESDAGLYSVGAIFSTL